MSTPPTGGARVVVVVAPATVVVVVGVVVQAVRVMVLVSKVTAPFRASARPSIVAPVLRVIEVSARMLPRRELLVPSVAELPTCQNTFRQDRVRGIEPIHLEQCKFQLYFWFLGGKLTTMEREVYPNAPLALVVVEVRFPSEASGLLLNTTQQRRYRDLLGDHDWVIEGAVQQEYELTLGPGAPASQTVRTTPTPRFTIRDRTIAITAAPTSLRIETTRYRGYDSFRELLQQVFEATSAVARPDGIARVGLRYIDEIRVPGINEGDFALWTEWVHHSLIAPPHPDSLSELEPAVGLWNGVAQYGFGADRYLVLRYGPGQGFAVNPGGPLRRLPKPSPGPFFVMDFDSYWEPAELPEFDVPSLIDTCDLLHAPASAMFENFVTERLRNDVFRKDAL